MSDDFLASPPKKKKLPFKPTALRRAPKPSPAPNEEQGDDDGLDLFRRSKEMAPIVAADRERRLKRKQKQRELEDHREPPERRLSGSEKRSFQEEQPDGPSSGGDFSFDGTQTQEADPLAAEPNGEESTQRGEDRASELVTPPPSKRSRTSTESSKKASETIEEAVEEVTEPSPSSRKFLRSYIRPESPVRQSPRTRSAAAAASLQGGSPIRQPSPRKVDASPGPAPVISLDSDSEDDVKPSVPPPHERANSIDHVEFLGGSSPQPSTPNAPQAEAEDDEFAEYVRRAEAQRAKGLQSTPGSSAKESTQIYISSSIPGSSAVMVKFLFDKPLRLVGQTWLAMQRQRGANIPIDSSEEIVLTWRRKRVYNYSTLGSLGIRPQGDGRLVADTFGLEGFSESRTRVHLETWTPDMFRQMEEEEELRRRREAGEVSDEEDAPEEEATPEVKLRVILKPRDLEDVKLTVRPETTVETLVTGFRTQRGVDASKDVSLYFDGDRLEEHMTMTDAEIDDMDTIEVHIK